MYELLTWQSLIREKFQRKFNEMQQALWKHFEQISTQSPASTSLSLASAVYFFCGEEGLHETPSRAPIVSYLKCGLVFYGMVYEISISDNQEVVYLFLGDAGLQQTYYKWNKITYFASSVFNSSLHAGWGRVLGCSVEHHSPHFSIAMIVIKKDPRKDSNKNEKIESATSDCSVHCSDSLRQPNTEKAEKATAAGWREGCFENGQIQPIGKFLTSVRSLQFSLTRYIR